MISIEECASSIIPIKSSSLSISYANNIRSDILHFEPLNEAIKSLLPSNYNFEIHKTIDQIQKYHVQKLALQLPEGLQMFATSICIILKNFAYHPMLLSDDAVGEELDIVILADVTYGACCIDDYSAQELGCDFLIHYGHSCLIPVTKTLIRVLYVFVELEFNVEHLVKCVRDNFSIESPIILMGTIQFSTCLHKAYHVLSTSGYKNIRIPQSKPLSPGEVLGCTSPRFREETLVIYVGDGRFHLESMMIANPHLDGKFYKYDPYSGDMTREWYSMKEMLQVRKKSINAVRSPYTKKFAVVLGTLGRQGSVDVVNWLVKKIQERQKEAMVILMSELTPAKMSQFKGNGFDAWIQTSCPRLSIDWGLSYSEPLLTPYEANLALLNEQEWKIQKPKWIDCCEEENCKKLELQDKDMYPMDFYAYDSLGPWTPNHKPVKSLTSDQQNKRDILRKKLDLLRKKK